MRFEYAARLIDGKSLRGSRELEPGENIIRLSLSKRLPDLELLPGV